MAPSPHEEEEESEEEMEEEEEEEEEEEVEEEEEEVEEEEEEEEEEEVEEEEEEELEEEAKEDQEDEEEASIKDNESSTRDSVRKLLEPFGKDQLIDLLKEAVRSNPTILQKIASSAESDTTHRKIFVHGLGWDVSSENVVDVFRQYGEVEDCNVVTDRVTGRSKGYGFVLFKRRTDAQKALEEPQKKIGNRVAACQLASVGSVQPGGGEKKFDVRNLQSAEGLMMNKNLMPVGGIGAGVLQPNDLALTYGSGSLLGLNQTAALLGQSVYPPAAGIMGQNQVMATAGLPPAVNRSGATLGSYGSGLGLGGGALPGINSISPSVIGSYGPQTGLQGLGAFQSSSVPSAAGMRTQSSVGSLGANLPHYLGRK